MPVPPRPRLWISLALGIAAMMVTHVYVLTSPVPRDFALFRQAALAALHGQDVYAAVPGLAYPLPGMLLVIPWAPLSDVLASAAFMFLSASAFAWALMAQGYGPLLGFFTPGMLFAAQVGQWAPMFAASLVIAPLSIFLIVKPHVGFACWLARPRWWTIASALICGSLAFALQPTWVHDWRASMASGSAHLGAGGKGNYQYLPPIMLPGGILALAAITRWRRPEARLLVALACVPQSLHLYEIVPLALVPRGWKQSTAYLGLSHIVWLLLGNHTMYPNYIAYTTASGKLYTLLIFVPLTAMVLLRPNEGRLPVWIETRLSNVPLWLRGQPASNEA